MSFEFSFHPMDAASALEITAWRYPERYRQYNLSEAGAAEVGVNMLLPTFRFFTARRSGELVGFCSFGVDGRVPGYCYDDNATDVGAGLRPDLTGGGMGGDFLRAVVAHAHQSLSLTMLRATVASWNERALRAARRAGFRDQEMFSSPSGLSFTVLTRAV